MIMQKHVNETCFYILNKSHANQRPPTRRAETLNRKLHLHFIAYYNDCICSATYFFIFILYFLPVKYC